MDYQEPQYSCPDIDNAIKEVDGLSFNLKDKLESLRTHNEELREWGVYWRDEAERLQDLLDEIDVNKND